MNASPELPDQFRQKIAVWDLPPEVEAALLEQIHGRILACADRPWAIRTCLEITVFDHCGRRHGFFGRIAAERAGGGIVVQDCDFDWLSTVAQPDVSPA
jgi:hypothetical protein